MKRLYTLLISSLVSVTCGFAQLTQATHAPASGDTWTVNPVDSAGVKPGSSGTGVTWNFSGITVNTAQQVNYTAANVTNSPNYPAANVSVTATNSEFEFYNSTSSALFYQGGKWISQGNSFVFGYTSPAVAGFYPMTINTPSTVSTAGTVNVSVGMTNAAGSFAGTSTVIADATGTLTLPGTSKTFTDVTRTAFSQNLTFTVTVSGFPVSGTMHEITYEYYQTGIKAPVFSISNFTVTAPVIGTIIEKFVTANKGAVGTSTSTTTVSINYVEPAKAEIKLYPNPANHSVSLRADAENWQTIEIYDLTGRLVESKELMNGKVTVDVSAYKEGLYIYSLKGFDSDRKHTGKLTVAH